MDPQTRRFELLQLEFDTNKASVADILQQIPISATEESLRTQTFDCVCDTDGKEYDQDKPEIDGKKTFTQLFESIEPKTFEVSNGETYAQQEMNQEIHLEHNDFSKHHAIIEVENGKFRSK